MIKKLGTPILCLVGFLIFELKLSSAIPILIVTLLTLIFNVGYPYSVSPVSAVAWLFLFTGIIGYLVSESKNSTLGTSFGYLLPSIYHSPTLSLFCAASLSLTFGSLVNSKLVVVNKVKTIDINDSRITSLRRLATLPIIGLFIGFSPQDFLLRDNHLLEPNISLLARLSLALSLLAVPALGALGYDNNRSKKTYSLLLILAYGACFFAMSSRALVVVPLSIIILFWSEIRRWKVFVVIFILPIACYVSILVPLFLRSLNSHGLLPYVRDLNNFRFSTESATFAFQNFAVAFDLNGLTAFEVNRYPIRDLFIQISPLLGEGSGWYQIADSHRFNFATPVAALGELLNYGDIYFIVILVLIGSIIGLLNRLVISWTDSFRTFGTVILYAGSFYFGTLCLQYNLRSAVRIVYYMTFLIIIMNLIERRKIKLDYRKKLSGL